MGAPSNEMTREKTCKGPCRRNKKRALCRFLGKPTSEPRRVFLRGDGQAGVCSGRRLPRAFLWHGRKQEDSALPRAFSPRKQPGNQNQTVILTAIEFRNLRVQLIDWRGSRIVIAYREFLNLQINVELYVSILVIEEASL
jgi:hypothetical protein